MIDPHDIKRLHRDLEAAIARAERREAAFGEREPDEIEEQLAGRTWAVLGEYALVAFLLISMVAVVVVVGWYVGGW